MAEPQTGKAPTGNKPGRTRAACSACRSNKQKCDGAQRQPCRRCELYGIVCEFPGVNLGKIAAGPMGIRPSASHASSNSTTSSDTVTLEAIMERLRIIELGLENDRRTAARTSASATAVSSGSPSGTHNLSDPDASASPLPPATDFLVDEAELLNPGRLVSDSIGISGLSLGQDGDYAADSLTSGTQSIPDAIVRGLVTVADCEAAFTFYHERLQPWVPGDATRHNPITLQVRSPFLFHVILLATSYYSREDSTVRAQKIVEGLNAIVHELLAELVLAPDKAHFTLDLVTAFVILIVFRPVQHKSFARRGLRELESIELASKSNPLSASMIMGLLEAAATACRLQSSPAHFLQSLWTPSPDPGKSRKAIADLRMWYGLCMIDLHGSLQAGRKTVRDPRDALRTTRAFVALKADVCDPRRAALFELYATVSPYTALIASVKINALDLSKVNSALDQWEQHWRPILLEAELGGDSIAYTAIQVNLQFIRISANISVFHRWTAARAKSLAEGGSGRPALNDADWSHLGRSAQAVERMIFTVSKESESSSNPLKGYLWPKEFDGNISPLHLSPTAVEDHRCSLDTITTLVYMYAVLMVVRMSSAGLIACNLTTKRTEYESGSDLALPQALTPGRKLPCLLELAAAFLDSLAPSRRHPARKHAALLRFIRRVGLGEYTAASPVSPPAGPMNGQSSSPPNPRPSPPSNPNPNSNPTATPLPWLPHATGAGNNFLDDDMQSANFFPQPNTASASAPLQPGNAMASVLSSLDPLLLDGYDLTSGLTQTSATEAKGFDLDMENFDWDALQKQIEQAPPTTMPSSSDMVDWNLSA